MNKRKFSWSKKFGLIIFGIFLGLFLLEIALRVGGFVFLSLQEYRNRIAIAQKGGYCILCLGESTTALGGEYSWPSQLEEILNRAQIGIKFKVINKGIPGISTSGILYHLEKYLDEYEPNMVITMIGINDCGKLIPYRTDRKHIFQKFRSYKLFKITIASFWHKIKKQREFQSLPAKDQSVRGDKFCSYFIGDKNNILKNYSIHLQYAKDLIQKKRYSEAEVLLKKNEGGKA